MKCKRSFAVFTFLLISTFAFGGSEESGALKLVKAAQERTKHIVIYNGAYRSISYPMGDVPNNIGVCTDVIIRSYRKLGVDLQELVHNDMKANFDQYPNNWGLTRTDTNIDHRRVPNLQAFFRRHGEALPISQKADDYLPGDIVTWMLKGNLPHIGIVSSKTNRDGRPYIIHNIGWGPKEDDRLFAYKITGHYRYQASLSANVRGDGTAEPSS